MVSKPEMHKFCKSDRCKISYLLYDKAGLLHKNEVKTHVE